MLQFLLKTYKTLKALKKIPIFDKNHVISTQLCSLVINH